MSVGVVWFVCEPVLVHDFAADEGFEGERSEHVEAEEEAGNIDHQVVLREVVEHVAKRLVAKGQKAR